MTENEAKWEYCRAIDIIKRIKTEETHERYIDRHKAFDLAIQALEEIQQYRAIGTPTQIYEKIGGLDVELGKYHSIGTIDEFKALKENQRKCEECAGCTAWNCDCANERAKAIDEFLELAFEVFNSDSIGYAQLITIAEQMRGGGAE